MTPLECHVRRTQRLPKQSRRRRVFGPLLAVAAAAMLCLAAGSWAVTSMPYVSQADEPLELASPRVVVLKSRRILHLFDGDRLVRSYPIALGTQPAGQKVRADDGRTPEGRFRVCIRNAASEYDRFVGISYPDVDAARRGLRDGLITYGEFCGIRTAVEAGRCPNWTTALGGGIGIHGHGINGDWTAGCIAMNDEDVEELFNVLRVGDPVEILP